MAAGQEIELRLCSMVGNKERDGGDLASRFDPKDNREGKSTREEKKRVTAEDLDAELIAYMGGDSADKGSSSAAAEEPATTEGDGVVVVDDENEKEANVGEPEVVVVEDDVEMK